MNINQSQENHQSRLTAFFLILIATVASALLPQQASAQSVQAAGIVISRYSGLDTQSSYNGYAFKSFRDAGAWLSFDIGQTKPLEIEKGNIVKIIHFDFGYGNVLAMNILNDTHAEQIAAFSQQLKLETDKMPRVAELVKSTTSLLENQLSMYKSGNVRLDGRWIDKLTWEREQSNKMKSAIVIAGVSYTNPRFMSAKDQTIAFAHDGGIAKIPLAKLDQTSKNLIASTFKIDPALLATPASKRPSDRSMDQNPGAYLTEKMDKIIFPTFEFQNATLEEVIEYLRLKSRDLDTMETDATRKGVNIIIQGDAPADVSISLDLRNVPMSEALRYVCELAKMKFKVEVFAVLVVPLSHETSPAMTVTQANSNPAASRQPAPQPKPRIPSLPSTITVEAIGFGGSESDALLDAQFNGVSAVLENHISSTKREWNSRFTVANMGGDIARASDDYRRIAMKKGADGINLMIETKIPREKLVPIFLKLGFVE